MEREKEDIVLTVPPYPSKLTCKPQSPFPLLHSTRLRDKKKATTDLSASAPECEMQSPDCYSQAGTEDIPLRLEGATADECKVTDRESLRVS